MRFCQGLTLVELMTSVSIAGILLTIALPNYQDFIIKMRVDNEISQLQRLLLMARNSAINEESTAILCPLDTNNTCNGDWNAKLSIFIDFNNNQRFDSQNEQIIVVKPPISRGDKLLYAKRRNKISFSAEGHLRGLSNGTFRYCPASNLKLARGIIIAVSGRFYLTRDQNNDGIEENRSGKALVCS